MSDEPPSGLSAPAISASMSEGSLSCDPELEVLDLPPDFFTEIFFNDKFFSFNFLIFRPTSIPAKGIPKVNKAIFPSKMN